MRTLRTTLILCVAVAVTAITCVWAPAAFADPWWSLSARAAPTYLAPGHNGLIDVSADDLGDEGVSGASDRVTISDLLPEGLEASEAGAINAHRARAGNRGTVEEKAHWNCTLAEQNRLVSCSTDLAIPPYEPFEVEIPVRVNEPTGTETSLPNQAGVLGGDSQAGEPAPGASLTRPVRISGAQVPFGLEEGGYQITPENESGGIDTQAGSHPFQLTSTVDFDQTLEEVQEPGQPAIDEPAAIGLPRNLSFQLPPGLLGNVTAAEQCSQLDFAALKSEGNSCPTGSAVGVATVTVLEPSRAKYITKAVPLFNLEPEQGEPARFGFEAVRVPVLLDTSVRTGGDYGVTVSVDNATEAAQVLGAQVTFWGYPGSPAHDGSRGWACLREGAEAYEGETCQPPDPRPTVPLLTLPTSCTGPLSTELQGTAWNGEPIGGRFTLKNALGSPLPALENCAALPFEPSLEIQPDQAAEEQEGHSGEPASVEPTTSASTPTGLKATVTVAQEGTLSETELADADVNSAQVTLPAGLLLNPAAAGGLQACSEQQIGYQGPPAEPDPLEPGASQPQQFNNSKPACPAASKIGTVQINTPLLSEELRGSVYLATPAPNGEPGQNPFDSLIALYILAENETLGLRVKLAGQGELDERTGQITTSFKTTPQVPFERLTLQLFGGPRGSLTTPPACGSYTATSAFTSWSGAQAQPEAKPSFQITSGPAGHACPAGSLPFTPSFQAGSTSSQAGAFTSFTLQLTNPDGDQSLSGLSMHLPAGVAAQLAHVTPCPEPQASRNECGSESLVGSSLAGSGLGPDPVELPGQVYLTGPYQNAPFGLAVVTPAVAGPFNLGDVTVRSRIDVDPHTAQVTITSDPFPLFVKGVPVDLKQIQVQVNRPDFEYNPTNCRAMSIEGALGGSEGASASLSTPFQASGCQDLPFKPGVKGATRGATSKADGASLALTFKSQPGEAHVAKTILTIPATLPARLTTIQKACVAATFEVNPAACGEGSDIGTAVVHTPVLKNPLIGPIYLVSHGNAAWPDAELVLQGEGVEVILDGQTAIKKGVTTSSFLSVPDAPFESVQATLPEGPHSALTTNLPLKDHYSLCGQKLTIPTALTGQNGTAVNETVKVNIEGCRAVKAAKAKKLTRRQKLTRALKACRKAHPRARAPRVRCERRSRRRYRG
ncbi:MAG TPA: hypothetical protein VMB51_10430 [Solirubrobacteraceae bacterium]|nr:hypothetical protein [Solirubrobacteraceae bacterium]